MGRILDKIDEFSVEEQERSSTPNSVKLCYAVTDRECQDLLQELNELTETELHSRVSKPEDIHNLRINTSSGCPVQIVVMEEVKKKVSFSQFSESVYQDHFFTF